MGLNTSFQITYNYNPSKNFSILFKIKLKMQGELSRLILELGNLKNN